MISDADLISELHRSGRPITVDLLATLRRSSLLPPLKARGLGQGKGKAFYNDGDILSRAKFAYDANAEFGDTRQALWCLWVAGFDVAQPRLKRIWINRLSRKHGWAVPRDAISRKRPDGREQLFSQVEPKGLAFGLIGALALFEPLSIRDDWLRWSVFVTAVVEISSTFASDEPTDVSGEFAKLARFLPLILDAAEGTDLVRSASSSQLMLARDLARSIGRIADYSSAGLFRVAPVVPYWTPYYAAHIGTPLIISILLLGRAGLIDRVKKTACLLEKAASEGSAIDRASICKRLFTIWRDV